MRDDDLGHDVLGDDVMNRAAHASIIPPFPERLEHGDFLLRPVSFARDAVALHAASNGSPWDDQSPAYDPDEMIWRYMFGGPYPGQAAFDAYMRGLEAFDDGLALCIVERATDRPLGIATYCANRPSHLSIELGGIWYTPAFQRTAANTTTIYLMLRHAFDTLGYRRVEWKCDDKNRRSKRAAERLGFRYEGLFRAHMIIKGQNRDTAWFAITGNEWPGVRAKLEAKLAR